MFTLMLSSLRSLLTWHIRNWLMINPRTDCSFVVWDFFGHLEFFETLNFTLYCGVKGLATIGAVTLLWAWKVTR